MTTDMMGARLSRRASRVRGTTQQPILHRGPRVDEIVLRVRMPDEYIARVCVLGEPGIGKTSLAERFAKNQYTEAGTDDEADEDDYPTYPWYYRFR